MIAVFYSDHYPVPLPKDHPFPLQKYRLVRERLTSERTLKKEWLMEAQPVDPRLLLSVHTQEYIDQIFKGALEPKAIRRLGLPWSEGLATRSAASVGGTIGAAWAALEEGIAGNLGGGTHHAFPDRGEAFCVFNDIAVAAKLLLQKDATGRVTIVDLDVHQGDGTAEIFRYDRTVFTLSIHAANNYPIKKAKSSHDVSLPDGTSDEAYLTVLQENLSEAIDNFKPDIVFYQAGVDPLAGDSLGRLSLSHRGLKERDIYVLETCRNAEIPIVITMGGGYAKPISETVEAHCNTYRAVREVFG